MASGVSACSSTASKTASFSTVTGSRNAFEQVPYASLCRHGWLNENDAMSSGLSIPTLDGAWVVRVRRLLRRPGDGIDKGDPLVDLDVGEVPVKRSVRHARHVDACD